MQCAIPKCKTARDEAQAEFRLASEELLRARENQRLAELEAMRAREILAMRTIRSPVTGVVVEVMRKPGEFGAISFKDPIMKLAEIDPGQALAHRASSRGPITRRASTNAPTSRPSASLPPRREERRRTWR